MTLPGVVARLRPTSNAPFLVCDNCPAAMSLSMLARPLSKFSPRVSIVRLSTVGLVSAKLRRRHGVDEALGRELQLLPRLGVEPLDLLDRAEQLVAQLQIALADGVEDRVLGPFGRGEAAVLDRLGLARRRHRGDPAEHLAPRLEAPWPRPAPRRSSAPSDRSRRAGRRADRRLRPVERRHRPCPPGSPKIPSSSAARGPSPRSSAASPRASGWRRGVGLWGVGHGGPIPSLRAERSNPVT